MHRAMTIDEDKLRGAPGADAEFLQLIEVVQAAGLQDAFGAFEANAGDVEEFILYGAAVQAN